MVDGRMSAIWGPQSALDLYLQEEGITTLLMSGVNADQVNENPTCLLRYVPELCSPQVTAVRTGHIS